MCYYAVQFPVATPAAEPGRYEEAPAARAAGGRTASYHRAKDLCRGHRVVARCELPGAKHIKGHLAGSETYREPCKSSALIGFPHTTPYTRRYSCRVLALRGHPDRRLEDEGKVRVWFAGVPFRAKATSRCVLQLHPALPLLCNFTNLLIFFFLSHLPTHPTTLHR